MTRETLKEVVDRLADAEIAQCHRMGTFAEERDAYKRVAYAAIRAALAEPTQQMERACELSHNDPEDYKSNWNAMAAERLKELA